MTRIRPISLPLLARLTVAWGVLFAVVHFYWAAGGTALGQSGASDAAENAYIAFIAVLGLVRQLGHDARLTLSRYGHVIDELDEQPRIDAETAIREARIPSAPVAPTKSNKIPNRKKPEDQLQARLPGSWS